MAAKRSDAARDYKAKIALESRFREAYRPVERRLVKDVIREVARSGTLPDVKSATRRLAEPVLLKQYRATAKEFSGRVRERLPRDVRSTRQEDEEIAAALGVLLLARSKRQAEFIGTTNQNDATDSLRIAHAERERRVSAGEGLMGATELALTAGTIFDSRLKGRTAGIALVETEAVAEVSKLTEAEYLLGTFHSEDGAPTKKTDAFKEWVSQGDQRVRPAHLAADSDQVKVNEPFLVGGERLMHPGDTSLGATMKNIANCRCTVVYDVVAIAEARQPQFVEAEEIETPDEETTDATACVRVGKSMMRLGAPISVKRIVTDCESVSVVNQGLSEKPPTGRREMPTSDPGSTGTPSNQGLLQKYESGRDVKASMAGATQIEHRKKLASQMGITEPELNAKLQAKVEKLVGESGVNVRVRPKTLDSVLADGRFKSQMETGRSGGLFDPEMRAGFEKGYFGVAEDLAVEQRPIYGYLSSHRQGLGHGDLDQYGMIVVKLNDKARMRATWTMGDSLEQNELLVSRNKLEEVQSVFSPVAAPKQETLSLSFHRAGERTLEAGSIDELSKTFGYMEAQVWGGVRVEDIEEVVLEGPTQVKRFGKKLEERGIKYSIREDIIRESGDE